MRRPAPEALDRPAQKRHDWYVPTALPDGHTVVPEEPRKPRKRSLAHVAEFPMPDLEGEWHWRQYDPSVRRGGDWAVNGVVAVGPLDAEDPSVLLDGTPAAIASTLVDWEDERGRVPRERF